MLANEQSPLTSATLGMAPVKSNDTAGFEMPPLPLRSSRLNLSFFLLRPPFALLLLSYFPSHPRALQVYMKLPCHTQDDV